MSHRSIVSLQNIVVQQDTRLKEFVRENARLARLGRDMTSRLAAAKREIEALNNAVAELKKENIKLGVAMDLAKFEVKALIPDKDLVESMSRFASGKTVGEMLPKIRADIAAGVIKMQDSHPSWLQKLILVDKFPNEIDTIIAYTPTEVMLRWNRT